MSRVSRVYNPASTLLILQQSRASAPVLQSTCYLSLLLFQSPCSLSLPSLPPSAAAGPFRRSPTLSIDVSDPESVKSLNELSVVATVTNTGSEAVKVLKAGSVLDDQLPTRSFFVKKGDSKVDFSGVKVTLAMDKLGEDNYVTIQPGSSVNATHDCKYHLHVACIDFISRHPSVIPLQLRGRWRG